jgi:two-component system, LytTR family, response regulator
MIHAIAIDDEPKALEIIENHAAKIPFIELEKVFTNPFDALEYIKGHGIDLIFLDIMMPDLSGMQFLQRVGRSDYDVIFTTAHNEYASESYEAEAIDYLLKPFDFQRFQKAVRKVRSRFMENTGSGFFFANSGHKLYKIKFSEIDFVKCEGNYVVYFIGKEKIMVRETVKDTLQRLVQYKFIQVHKSYVIPIDKVDKIYDNHIYIGAHGIPIGSNYRNTFFALISAAGK